MNVIKNCAYRALFANTARVQSKLDAQGKERPSLLFWPKDVSYVLNYYTNHPEMKKIVKFFLGEKVRQVNNQIYFRESGDGDQFAWHQDLAFRTPKEEFYRIETGYLQTVISIDEITEENGAVEFIPGSHRKGFINGLVPRDDSERGLREFIRGDYQGVKLCAKPGDVLLWDILVIHGSEQNTSSGNRMTYMNGFAKESAVLNKKKYPSYATT